MAIDRIRFRRGYSFRAAIRRLEHSTFPSLEMRVSIAAFRRKLGRCGVTLASVIPVNLRENGNCSGRLVILVRQKRYDFYCIRVSDPSKRFCFNLRARAVQACLKAGSAMTWAVTENVYLRPRQFGHQIVRDASQRNCGAFLLNSSCPHAGMQIQGHLIF